MAVTPTGDRFVDSILWGGWKWPSGELSYYFSDEFATWSSAEIEAYEAALAAWASVADLAFTRVFEESQANLVAHVLSDAQMRDTFTLGPDDAALGYQETPQDAAERGLVDGRLYADGFFNREQYAAWKPDWTAAYDPTGLEIGGYGYETFLRQIGLALGLALPHETGGESPLWPGVTEGDPFDKGSYNLNSASSTVMSSNNGWGKRLDDGTASEDRWYASGPAFFDISAIQYLYGANDATAGGDDVYRLGDVAGVVAIWDTGGIDKIRNDTDHDSWIILGPLERELGWNTGAPTSFLSGGPVFRGYAIADDFTGALADENGVDWVIIEKATGGGGNDFISGNDADNVLKGRGGIDNLHGHGGDDKIKGGPGNDSVVGGPGADLLRGGSGDDYKVYGGDGDDRIFGGAGGDNLRGEAGNDRVRGGSGDDEVRGGEGDDVLIGGTGDDFLSGGVGADTFKFRAGDDTDTINRFKPGTDILALDDGLWSGPLTVADIVARYVTVTGDDLVFEFDGGDRLVVQGVGDPGDLLADIVII